MTRTHTPTQTLKLIISAASVAATLTGWALLAIRNPPAATPTESLSQAPASVAPPPVWLTEPLVIPTLQPLIGLTQPGETAEFQSANPASSAGVNLPVLREVNTPVTANPPVQVQRPVPVVVTRSSQ